MHRPDHNETIGQILNFLDAQRPNPTASDNTRVEQDWVKGEEGSYVKPEPSQELPWVGTYLTDKLHEANIKDKDPEKAAKQKEALKGVIDFISPQTLGGVALMSANRIGNVVKGVAKVAKKAKRVPVSPVRSGEKNYFQTYEVKSVYKDASTKLPAFSQKAGTYGYKDSKYNFIETVRRRKGGGSKHSIAIRPRDSYNKSDDLGTLEFNVQSLDPKHKGMFAYERDHFNYILKGGDVSALNDPTQMAMIAHKYNMNEGQVRKLAANLKKGTFVDEAIEMTAGKSHLKSPKLIHNVYFKTSAKGTPSHSAKALKMVFDRMDDDWIIREDLMTLDSITMMLGSLLKNYAKEIEFFKNKGRNLYKKNYGSYRGEYSALSKQAVIARQTGTIGDVEAGLYDDIIKKLQMRLDKSGKLVGEPKFRSEGFDMSSKAFSVKSFKDKMAAIIGLSVVEMDEMLESITNNKDMIDMESLEKQYNK